MPTPVKPLFRPEALRPQLNAFPLPPSALEARTRILHWARLLDSKQAEKMKETELLPGFLNDVFLELLGFTGPAGAADCYTFKREATVQVDGKYADAVIGRFSTSDQPPKFVAALEGKAPRDPLDRPFANRKLSAVDQALHYAVNLECSWYLVTNLREIRLYDVRHDQLTFEHFETRVLAEDDMAFRRFVYLLHAQRVVPPAGPCHFDTLLAESRRVGRELTRYYYRDYAQLRRSAFDALRQQNPDIAPTELLAATQKILDRVLFVAFCEKRGLLPANIIARAYEHADPFNPRPIWHNFLGLFRAVNEGSQLLQIARYNGGLFAPDSLLERLAVSDGVCLGLKTLAEYEYGNRADNPNARLIDVEILGHIFEQSIGDLEEMQNQLAGLVKTARRREQKKSSQKEAGAFYTPAFITRHIVAETLGPLLASRFEELRSAHEGEAHRTIYKVLANPTVFDPAALTRPQTAALVRFWAAWLEELERVRILDPACGSGAFLIEAFDQMFAEYQKAQGFLTDLQGRTLFDIRKAILEYNLYGVDLDRQAVDIARLSCWIKTAEVGKVLTSLDHNIREGNSVVTDTQVHPKAFDWRRAFPEVFPGGPAATGFDVVIGNPPYVKDEWIKPYKAHWQEQFESFDSGADLFVYFCELGLKLLRPGGRLGYITSGAWVRGNYGGGLRACLAKNAKLESMIDFGEYQPFEDAEMIRPTIAVLSKRPPGGSMRLFKWLTSGKPPENLSEVIRTAPLMRTDHLGKDSWELEPDEVIALRKKLAGGGKRLTEYVDGKIYRGVLSGLTEVFVIDAARHSALLKADPNSEQIIKPFIQGTNVRPWYVEHSGEFLLAIKSSTDYHWPWSECGTGAEAVFAKTFPAVHAYLNQYREAAIKRTDQGRFWWELRSCAYWDIFDADKIVWPDIGNYPRFSLERAKHCLGNTTYTIASADAYLLGVLSSWASWFFISKTAQPLRLRSNRWQYRLFTQYTQNIPIPDAPPADRLAVAALAERCNTLGKERYELEEAVRHRLTQVFGPGDQGQPHGKLNEKAQEWWAQSLNALGNALKDSFKLKRNPFGTPKVADEWEPYLADKRQAVASLAKQLADAEADINERVYRLFQLTPDEVKLLQREVEH